MMVEVIWEVRLIVCVGYLLLVVVEEVLMWVMVRMGKEVLERLVVEAAEVHHNLLVLWLLLMVEGHIFVVYLSVLGKQLVPVLLQDMVEESRWSRR